jgi:anthranilate phosphoribosyltransferase
VKELSPSLERLSRREHLSRAEAEAMFAAIMAGRVDEATLRTLLLALNDKGETPDEIAGAAKAMRDAAERLDTGALDVADSCGTGGDGAQTVNISTAAAFVVAAGGVPVAKHGNRSISSRCGSADVLERCGVKIEAAPAVSRRCLDAIAICFLFAPQYHQGVRHAMPVRRALGVRTIFNLLGPLANPALPRFQLVGVYDPRRCRTLAETLGLLGCERAMVVHGGGLDELAIHDTTTAALLEGGEVRMTTITPESVGLERRALGDLVGGDPDDNAAWLSSLLAGGGSQAHRDAVALNAGALLWLCDKADTHRAGVQIAMQILESGSAAEHLARLAAMTQEA